MKSLATIFQHIDEQAVQTVEFTQTHENLITESLNLAQTLTDELGRTLHVSDVIHTLQMETMRDNTHSYTEREAKFLNLSIEALYSSIDYKPKNTLTLESLEYKTPTEKVHITLESISEFAKKLWEQIVKAFKRFIEYIKSFFKGSEIKAKYIEKTAEKIKKDISAHSQGTSSDKRKNKSTEISKQEENNELEEDEGFLPSRELFSLVSSFDASNDLNKIKNGLADYLLTSLDILEKRAKHVIAFSSKIDDYAKTIEPSKGDNDKIEKAKEEFIEAVTNNFLDMVNVAADEKLTASNDAQVNYTLKTGEVILFKIKANSKFLPICEMIYVAPKALDISNLPFLDKSQVDYLATKLAEASNKLSAIGQMVTANAESIGSMIHRYKNKYSGEEYTPQTRMLTSYFYGRSSRVTHISSLCQINQMVQMQILRYINKSRWKLTKNDLGI